MTQPLRLDPQHPESDLCFAVHCLTCGVIDIEGLHAWLMFAIENTETDAHPTVLFDLLDMQETGDLYKADRAVMKHVLFSAWLSDRRQDALIGLGLQRHPQARGTTQISTAKATAALARHPEVAQRFKALFLDTDVVAKAPA